MTTPLPFVRSSHVILTPRLILRTATVTDAEPLCQLLTNPANFPYEEAEKDLEVEQLRARIVRHAASTARGENGWTVVLLRDTGELIGYGGYECQIEWGATLKITENSWSDQFLSGLHTPFGVSMYITIKPWGNFN